MIIANIHVIFLPPDASDVWLSVWNVCITSYCTKSKCSGCKWKVVSFNTRKESFNSVLNYIDPNIDIYRMSTSIMTHRSYIFRRLIRDLFVEFLENFIFRSPKFLEILCGNKMPTRSNRGFYYRSYCLLNMFRVQISPSSGAQEYYTVVAACGISCCGFQVVGLVWSWGLCVRFAGCCFKAASCKL